MLKLIESNLPKANKRVMDLIIYVTTNIEEDLQTVKNEVSVEVVSANIYGYMELLDIFDDNKLQMIKKYYENNDPKQFVNKGYELLNMIQSKYNMEISKNPNNQVKVKSIEPEKKEETKVVEPKKEETKVVEPKKEETKVVEPKKEETKVVEPKKEETKVVEKIEAKELLTSAVEEACKPVKERVLNIINYKYKNISEVNMSIINIFLDSNIEISKIQLINNNSLLEKAKVIKDEDTKNKAIKELSDNITKSILENVEAAVISEIDNNDNKKEDKSIEDEVEAINKEYEKITKQIVEDAKKSQKDISDKLNNSSNNPKEQEVKYDNDKKPTNVNRKVENEQQSNTGFINTKNIMEAQKIIEQHQAEMYNAYNMMNNGNVNDNNNGNVNDNNNGNVNDNNNGNVNDNNNNNGNVNDNNNNNGNVNDNKPKKDKKGNKENKGNVNDNKPKKDKKSNKENKGNKPKNNK